MKEHNCEEDIPTIFLPASNTSAALDTGAGAGEFLKPFDFHLFLRKQGNWSF